MKKAWHQEREREKSLAPRTRNTTSGGRLRGKPPCGVCNGFTPVYSWENRTPFTPRTIKVAATLQNHMAGIMNYITFPITNASSEGMNSIILALRVAARGLPNFENFRARILFHLGKLDMEPA